MKNYYRRSMLWRSSSNSCLCFCWRIEVNESFVGISALALQSSIPGKQSREALLSVIKDFTEISFQRSRPGYEDSFYPNYLCKPMDSTQRGRNSAQHY